MNRSAKGNRLAATTGETILFALPVAFSAVLVTPVWADAGWITGGGNPQLMPAEHKTVSMESEVVNVQIGKEFATVDCKFEFKNSGPACKVTMGFPDVPIETNEGKRFPFFFSYHSFVNGKEVPTTVLEGTGEEEGIFWHRQEIDFAAHSKVSIRDVYTAPVGLGVDYGDNCSKLFCYLLKTGATWKGKIKSGLIEIKFDPGVVSTPLKLLTDERGSHIEPKNRPSNMVLYDSSIRATVKGEGIEFRFRNFDPKNDEDNIAVEFGKLSEEKGLTYFANIMQMYLENKRNTLGKEDLAALEKYVSECKASAVKKGDKKK